MSSLMPLLSASSASVTSSTLALGVSLSDGRLLSVSKKLESRVLEELVALASEDDGSLGHKDLKIAFNLAKLNASYKPLGAARSLRFGEILVRCIPRLRGTRCKEPSEMACHLGAWRDSPVERVVDQIGYLDTLTLDVLCCLLDLENGESDLGTGSVRGDS